MLIFIIVGYTNDLVLWFMEPKMYGWWKTLFLFCLVIAQIPFLILLIICLIDNDKIERNLEHERWIKSRWRGNNEVR
jgi:hypothetical protein